MVVKDAQPKIGLAWGGRLRGAWGGTGEAR